MKRLFSIHAAAFLPLFALTPLPGGQYRGPEFEAMAVSSRTVKPGSQSKSLTFVVAPTLADSFGSWEFWFEWNKDVLLRDRQAGSVKVLGDQMRNLLGKDRIEAATVYEEILPALESALAGKDTALTKACIHALGKTGEGDALAAIENALGRGDVESRHLAALALGQLEDRESLARLASLFLDANASAELRAHAGFGLGLRWEPEASALLREFLEKKLHRASLEGEGEAMVLAAVRAMGLRRDSQDVPFLIQKYDSLDRAGHSKARVALCAIVSSLGKIGDASALGALTSALKAKDIEIRRAAALACGDLGSDGAVAPLTESLTADSDPQTRGFAAISLGRIGGRDAKSALRREFVATKYRSVKEYCAIALGLVDDEWAIEPLEALLLSREVESTRSAAAVGLGFLGYAVSSELLLEVAEDRAEPAKLRGYAALSAGLVRTEAALPRLLAQLRKSDENLEEVRRGLVLGIGLVRDPAATEDLLRVLAEDKRDSVRGHAALALGMIRDKKAVFPLAEILAGKRRASAEARAFAGVALGALGDRYNYPRVAELFFNTNYRMRDEALDRAATYF